MKKITAVGLTLLALSSLAFAGVDPSSLKVKILGFAVSENENCTSPNMVSVVSSPTYQEMDGATLIDAASVPAGTYPCVMINISDHIKYTPASTTGSCTIGTEYTQDVCDDRGEQIETYELDILTATSATTNPSIATANCSGDEDTITLWLTTLRDEVAEEADDEPNDIFRQPTGTGQSARGGEYLSNSLTISGATVGRFQVDMAGKVVGTEAQCEMGQPTFGFLNGDVSQ